MAESKNVNMNISDGDAFFAHEVSVNFNPMQFIMDFKCITPRIDPRSKENLVLNMKHNIIMIDPYHAKRLCGLMGEMIKKYEADMGKIEKPQALKNYEKKNKKAKGKVQAKETGEKAESPSYFG